MSSRHEGKIKEGAKPLLDDGEDVIAAFVARPRGWTQAMAGNYQLGSHQQAKERRGADDAGFELASPMALALTPRRLITFKIGSPIGLGIGGDVKELVSAAPLADVDAIDVKRRALRQEITVTVRGSSFKLEANAAAGANELAAAFVRAKAAGTR